MLYDRSQLSFLFKRLKIIQAISGFNWYVYTFSGEVS